VYALVLEESSSVDSLPSVKRDVRRGRVLSCGEEAIFDNVF